MKKTLLKTALLASLAVSALNADTLRLEMGVGGWTEDPTGYASYTDTTASAEGRYETDQLGGTSTYAWLLLKHPILIIPNIRLEYVNIDDTGSVTGKFEDFDAGSVYEKASISMKQYDIIPYYNLLDNTFWTTLDLGIDVKVVDSTFKAENVTLNTGVSDTTYEDQKTVAIPMAYGRLRIEIPSTNIGLESDAKYITYDGSTVYDFRAKVDYTFDISPVIQPGIEIGYRTQKFDLESDDKKKKMDMEFSGVYAGLMLRF